MWRARADLTFSTIWTGGTPLKWFIVVRVVYCSISTNPENRQTRDVLFSEDTGLLSASMLQKARSFRDDIKMRIRRSPSHSRGSLASSSNDQSSSSSPKPNKRKLHRGSSFKEQIRTEEKAVPLKSVSWWEQISFWIVQIAYQCWKCPFKVITCGGNYDKPYIIGI